MKRCKNCGSLLDDDVKFCMYCGSKVEEEKPKEEDYISDEGAREYVTCPHCGAYLDKYDRFCPKCGIENEKYSGEARNMDSAYQNNGNGYGSGAQTARPKNPLECYKNFWKNAFNFKGRSTRSEYWWPFLINTILSSIITDLIDMIPQKEYIITIPGLEEFEYIITPITLIVSAILSLIIFIPDLACMVRRIRDTGKNPFCIFYYFIPIAGPFMILYYLVCRTDKYKY